MKTGIIKKEHIKEDYLEAINQIRTCAYVIGRHLGPLAQDACKDAARDYQVNPNALWSIYFYFETQDDFRCTYEEEKKRAADVSKDCFIEPITLSVSVTNWPMSDDDRFNITHFEGSGLDFDQILDDCNVSIEDWNGNEARQGWGAGDLPILDFNKAVELLAEEFYKQTGNKINTKDFKF